MKNSTISRLTVLAVYMPIVAGMGGNTSAQAMSVAIRGLAVGKVDRSMLRHIIYRETLVGILTGSLDGTSAGIYQADASGNVTPIIPRPFLTGARRRVRFAIFRATPRPYLAAA